MMKQFLAIILSFAACASLVHAQDPEGWGLSESKCQWMKVAPVMAENSDGKMDKKWTKCTPTGAGCIHKFCTGPSDDKGHWELGMCNKYCITLQERLPIEGLDVKSISGDSGVDLLGNYFGLWYKIGALVLGLISVLVIVISGVQIIFGGASEEGVSSAKTRIWAALLSLILLFSSSLILKTINPLFFT